MNDCGSVSFLPYYGKTSMTSASHKADVKKALAEKYRRLAAASGSKPKTEKLLRRANNYDRQAEKLSRLT